MLLHLLKKLILAIVALCTLGTIVFLLSRLLPGSFAEERILNHEAGYYSSSSSVSRQNAYLQFQQRAGLSKPVFYFSLSPTVLPDTLERVFPVARRQQIKELAFICGNWPAVAAYDGLVNEVLQQPTALQDTAVMQQLQQLRFSTDPQELDQAVQTLLRMQKADVQVATTAIAHQLKAINEPHFRSSYLIPELKWHGLNNQYHTWISGILAGDFGTSYRTGRPVLEMIFEAIGNTFWLLLFSIFIASVTAIELALQMAKGRMSWLRRITFPALFVLDSLPIFVLALLLLVLFANPSFLQIFPVYGMGYYMPQNLPAWQLVVQRLQFMALPIVTMVLANLPYITNQVYTSLQTALGADFTRTAKAKGLPEKQILRGHVFRNALIPIITLLSELLPALVDGAFIIETVFAIPGIGRLLVESVLARDYPVLLAIILVILTVRMIAYALADVGISWADPRIKQQLT